VKSDNRYYMHNLLSRITIDPNISHGKPFIRGMRWPVEVILDMLSAEMSISDILHDHPELEREDILASIQYAKLLVSGKALTEAI
jgi:uncharacterized protein (DUF433 family)